MKILFLTYDLPFPLDQGGKIRSYHLLKNLSKNHQITLFSFFRRENQKQYLQDLQPFCQKICTFKRIKVFSPHHLALSFIPKLPFPIALYWSPQLKNQLCQEIKNSSYDLLHFESFYTSLYLDEKLKIPQVLGTENIEWRVYQEFAKKQKISFLKYPMVWESLRTRWFEQKTWQKADLCLAVSEENAREINQITGKKVTVISNGVDLQFFNYSPARQGQKILFVGNFSYIQNQDAVRFLVKKIFPSIKQRVPEAQLLIVGRHPTKEIKNYGSQEIQIRSDLEDIREAYHQATLLLAPIRAGSGTKFKILEAMASGLPVVTTSVGIEGIQAQNGKEAIISDKPHELSRQTINLLNDLHSRQKLSKAGRQLVEKYYSWPKIVKKLGKAYEELIHEKT